ncbi:MAG: hypothetical protein BGO21_06000 [Dyadobacter sp. 50-39]|uniref:hypothetical protein n=1 Tax=Dyadobacter sp. 50-39 TaxID=1895756 RepID=UPI00095B50A7|nr:hypothetical protein [Dyadobacter sp. 50-39]OJV12302.1 MAG: hypothetical protein BGO21_06000 [Dyadobacter sp. 50-39]
MKKINLFSAIFFVLSLFIVSSCNKPDADPLAPVDRLVNKYGLTKLSAEATQAMVATGNYRNFDTVEEAEKFFATMRAIGKKGGSFTRKVDGKRFRAFSEGNGQATIPFGTAFTTLDLKKMASARGPENDIEPGSTSLERDWGVFADLMVSLTWGANYQNATVGASISSVGNYNTWTTTTSEAHYNQNSGDITFTLYGQVHANVLVQGVGTIQSYNGVITGSYNPSNGQSAVNWNY